jgi:hypothetical protein
MRFQLRRTTSAISVLCALPLAAQLSAQTKVDLRTQTKDADFSSLGPTKPAQTGASLPATCGQGEFFFLSSAPAGQNFYGCGSPNTWVLEGAATASRVPSESNHAGGVLTTDGTNPIWQPVAGDVSGTPGALTVTKLLGRALSVTAPVDGQLLRFSGATGNWSPIALGGDVSGQPSALQVSGLLGRPLATVPPADGQFLDFSVTTGLWQPAWFGGDISGSPASVRVTGILGRGILSATPLDGQLLEFSAANNAWQPLALGGDISGNPALVQVGGLQGRQVSPSAPNDGQLMLFNAAPGQWQPTSISGDISGRPTAITVSAIRGKALSTVAPSDGQVLKFNGPANWWEPIAFGGDVSGSPASLSVVALHGNPIAVATPGDGQVLTYSVAAKTWEPLSFGGDLAGSPAAAHVAGLQGRPVSNAPPLNGQVLGWNSSLSSWLPVNGSGLGGSNTPNYNLAFTSQTLLSIPGTQHGLGTSNLIVACYDTSSPANYVEPSHVTVDPVAFNVTITFDHAQSGRCVLNGSGSGATGGSTITGTAVLAFPAIANGACSADLTVTVPGVNPGDAVAPGWPALPAGTFGMMRVGATGSVSVRLCNLSGASVTLPSMTYAATVVGPI